VRAEQRAHIEARLQERLEELIRMRAAMTRPSDPGHDSEPDVANHPADRGSDLHDEELDETTRMLLADDERRIEEARRALADGTYGSCAECGREIPPARLAAMPEAVRCVDCQRHLEGRNRQRTHV
jgi:DnaK suppressor protein